MAKDQYGIEPQIVRVRERGKISDQPLILGRPLRVDSKKSSSPSSNLAFRSNMKSFDPSIRFRVPPARSWES